MAHKLDVTQLRAELVDAFEWNEEDRARAVMVQLAAQPSHARVVLDEMLASEDASSRRAAVFGLGQLGGAASVKRLEQQMAIEEARSDHDGASVLEVITQELGRIKEVGARASLIRRLKRLVGGKPGTTDVNDFAYALWRKRHPELIPVVRTALEQFPVEDSGALRALLRLLETSPAALAEWILDGSAPLTDKRKVLTILDEEVPDELLAVLPAFITQACRVGDTVQQQGEAAGYCNRLFITLLLHWEQAACAAGRGPLRAARSGAQVRGGARAQLLNSRRSHAPTTGASRGCSAHRGQSPGLADPGRGV